MTIKELKDHSDNRDDIIQAKLDKIDDFLRNGLSDKIIKGITEYLNEQLAIKFRLFYKILISTITATIVGCLIKAIWF